MIDTHLPPPQQAKRKRCVIYLRVSLDVTGDGRSVERQLHHCQRLADYREYDVITVITDNSVSAYGNKKRPGWTEVLRMVAAGEVDVIVAWHFDRMTRSMRELEDLILLAEQHGVGIATAVGDIDLTTDMGKMIARILAAVARCEVERKAERQRSANEQRATDSGEPWTGGARPFGYGADQKTVIQKEADAIVQAAALALSGVPMREIARRWDSAGLISSRAVLEERPMKSDPSIMVKPTQAGWSGRGVKNVLVNPRYAGVRTYRGKEVGKGTWTPILDLETHLALRARLTDPARRLGLNMRGRSASTLLSGIAQCGVCHTPVNASSYAEKGVRFGSYTCRPGQHLHPVRELADKWVVSKLLARLAMPDARRLVVDSLGDEHAQRAQAELDRINDKLNKLVGMFNADALTDEQLASGTQDLKARKKQLEDALARAGGLKVVRKLSIGTDKVVGEWAELSLDTRRSVIAALMDVVINPVGPGQRLGWDPELHMTAEFKQPQPLP